MFSSEVLASLAIADGSTVSFLIDRSLLVQQSEALALLKLPLAKRHRERECDVVMLPVETLETGARWVELPLE
ncbi:hypothetical protein WL51_02590 [Burkholderia ubonensis]|nr:hypothetical protein WJ73_23140 [Burkholderia ubonensis]KVO22319.1 hypothetical protein WJ74_01860 [Burkholderia ubonensis]KVU29856.1 hypothetical protein WK66_06560 [Burkholderia ubonensis]KVV28628.1 hypothetical protein WK79_08925 [Burkholderia ubonensis]KWC01695.1 hypothetical protein WL44_28005 [Burkholderia ubonensis]